MASAGGTTWWNFQIKSAKWRRVCHVPPSGNQSLDLALSNS
jgi:hypothetical protein